MLMVVLSPPPPPPLPMPGVIDRAAGRARARGTAGMTGATP